jgi:hypothetical protein
MPDETLSPLCPIRVFRVLRGAAPDFSWALAKQSAMHKFIKWVFAGNILDRHPETEGRLSRAM